MRGKLRVKRGKVMMLNEDLLLQLHRVEAPFLTESLPTRKPYAIESGKVPVMISAPHSVSQWRRDAIKRGEYRTGSLARILRQRTDCHCMYKTRNMRDDANYDEENPYRTELVAYLQKHGIMTLVDLHIMRPDRPSQIDIGTGHGKNVQFNIQRVYKVVKAFQDNGIEQVSVDEVFSASTPATVSATAAREANVFALQIEMNWRILDVSYATDSLQQVIQGLTAVIDLLNGE